MTLHVGVGRFDIMASEGSDELLEFFTAELDEDFADEPEEAALELDFSPLEEDAALELELLICGIRVESKIAV